MKMNTLLEYEVDSYGDLFELSTRLGVLALLTNPWSGSSFILERYLQELTAKLEKTKTLKIHAKQYPELAERLGAKELPCLTYLKDNQIRGSVYGLVGRTDLERKLVEWEVH